MPDDYGVANLDLYGEEDLFTKITSQMREATSRDTYQDFFQIQQGALEESYLGGLSKKMGVTSQGKARGFAGSSDDDSMSKQLEGAYAREVMGVEEGITEKMTSAQDTIRSITQANQSTSLQLKQLEDADDPDDGTSWICGEIKRDGNMTKIESLKMLKFLLKSLVTHPVHTYWYIAAGKSIINRANKIMFDWGRGYIKDAFVNDILKLEENNKHDEAALLYFKNCLILAEAIKWTDGIDIVKPLPSTIINKVIHWWKFIKMKETWTVGIPYLKSVIKYRAYGLS